MGGFFSGKTALVTGASSGLGRELATQLSARGARLVITARRVDQLEALAEKLRAADGATVHVVGCDLGAVGGAAELCRRVDELGEDVQLVVNNAGRATTNAFAASDIGVETSMLRLNCEAPIVLARHFLPRLAAGGGLINVGSVAGMLPIPGMAVYGGSKAFVMSWSRALAEELRGTGVRVLTLAPGPVSTGFQKVANYELSGLEKIAEISPAEVVRIALDDYVDGRGESSPGVVMSMAKPLIGASPTGLVTRIAGQVLRKRW